MRPIWRRIGVTSALVVLIACSNNQAPDTLREGHWGGRATQMTDKKKKNYKAMSFGELLVTGAEEAAAIARGELAPARVTRVRVTVRQAAVTPPPRYRAKRIRAVRQRLGLSQPVFARALNVSLGTVRGWEQGARVPDGPSRRLLQMAEQHPDIMLASLTPQTRAS